MEVELVSFQGALSLFAWRNATLLPADSCTLRSIASMRFAAPDHLCQIQPLSQSDGPAPVLPRTTRFLGHDGLAAWKSLHIGIVGAGRLGSQLVASLTAQGIRHFQLIDPDGLEAGNLDGSSLMPATAIGTPKVQALAQSARRLYPDTCIDAVDAPCETPQSLEALLSCDVLITAVDHAAPRIRLAALARKLMQPLLDIGTATQSDGSSLADIRLILPDGRCLLCLGGTALGAPRVPGRSIRAINAVAANLAVQLLLDAIRIPSHSGSRWLRVRIEADGRISSQVMPASESPLPCPWCGTGTHSEEFSPHALRITAI
jgi:molybdopterin/thiamine biosynthesis adenylyltransferase